MKRMLSTTEYSFDAAGSRIYFSTFPDFDPKRLLAVINTTRDQTLIYATGGGASSPVRGSFGGSPSAYQLNFNYDTTSMADADILQIIYDEPVGTEEAKASIDIVSGKSGLDVNLLNSSFGGTVGDVMPSPFQDNALSIGVLNGGVLESPAMNVNNELIVDVTQSGLVPVTFTETIGTDIDSWGGNALSGFVPIPATPTNPVTGVYQSFGAGATDANTQRVTANINQISDVFFSGTSQSVSQNNIISGTTLATDCLGFRSFSAQLVCTATAGTMFFEGSNDNISFQSIPVFNQNSLNGTSFTTAITASLSNFIYTGSLPFRYLRIRIASSLTGGTVTAHVKLSPIAFVPTVMSVAQNASANLNCTVTGTVTANTAGASLQASTIVDIASATITSTTTTGTLALTNNQSVAFHINVTATSGTGNMDVVIQETFDGTNWFDVYHFPRITTAGRYYTPLMSFTGSSYRVVRTLSGTSPSFTSSLIRKLTQVSAPVVKMFINRTIDPNALASSTQSFYTDGCDKLHLCISMDAGGSGTPTFKLQGSEDNLLWYDLGTATVAVAPSSAGVAIYSGYLPKFTRAQVTAAGSGTTLAQCCIKGLK